MFEVIDNYVLRVEEVVTPTQRAVVKTFYDMLYHTELFYDPARGKVRASVLNYLGEPVTDFADPIMFELDGQQIEATPVDGVAEIDFVAEVPGEYVVRTVNAGIRNGEVTIRVE